MLALLAQWITFVSLFAPAEKGSIRILEGLLPLVIPEGEIITLERVNIISWRDRAGLFQGLVGDHRDQRFLGQGLYREGRESPLIAGGVIGQRLVRKRTMGHVLVR